MRSRLNLFLSLLLTVFVFACHKDEPIKEQASDNKEAIEQETPAEQKNRSKQEAKLAADSLFMKMNQEMPRFEGRCINVSVCGVDSRLNDNVQHADANHVLRFWIDQGVVEIVDIPRDTHADAGFPDTTNLNNLANLRANKGRNEYLRKVASIVGIPKIDYYCELGFSQAQGLLELLGHKESKTTLRVLRSRQAFDAGDYQRTYNQGVFMSKMLLRHFDKTTGWLRDPLLRAGLLLVESNIPLDTMKMIVDRLKENGFPENKQAYVHIMPKFNYKLLAYDLSDESVVEQVNQRIDSRLKKLGIETKDSSSILYQNKLQQLVATAATDTAKRPRNAINLLRRPYVQRAWLQVHNSEQRKQLAQSICTILIAAYNKTGKKDEAMNVLSFYEQQKELIEQKEEK